MGLSSRIVEQRPDLPEIESHPQVVLVEPKKKLKIKTYTQGELEDFEDIFEWLSRY